MNNESVATASSDPLKAVADALDAAVQGAGNGVERTRAAVSDALPAAGQVLARALYNTSYAISFGVVFPAVLAARSIPKENALVHGFVDGAQAARDFVGEMKAKSPSGETH